MNPALWLTLVLSIGLHLILVAVELDPTAIEVDTSRHIVHLQQQILAMQLAEQTRPAPNENVAKPAVKQAVKEEVISTVAALNTNSVQTESHNDKTEPDAAIVNSEPEAAVPKVAPLPDFEKIIEPNPQIVDSTIASQIVAEPVTKSKKAIQSSTERTNTEGNIELEAKAWLKNQLSHLIQFPAFARKNGWQEEQSVEVSFDNNGQIVNFNIISVSKHPIFLRQTKKAFKKLAKKRLTCCSGSEFSVIFEVSYRLED